MKLFDGITEETGQVVQLQSSSGRWQILSLRMRYESERYRHQSDTCNAKCG